MFEIHNDIILFWSTYWSQDTQFWYHKRHGLWQNKSIIMETLLELNEKIENNILCNI